MTAGQGNKSSYATDGNVDAKFQIKWNLSHHIKIIFEISEVEEKRESKGRRLKGSAQFLRKKW